MELSSWYIVLGVAIITIGFIERFVLYRLLVDQGRWLPEKATKVANLSCGITVAVGVVIVAANAFLAKH